MNNEDEANAPQANTLHENGKRRDATIGELRVIVACSVTYGVVHFVSIIAVLYFPEVLKDQWYNYLAFWVVMVGIIVCGLLLRVWSFWKNIS